MIRTALRPEILMREILEHGDTSGLKPGIIPAHISANWFIKVVLPQSIIFQYPSRDLWYRPPSPSTTPRQKWKFVATRGPAFAVKLFLGTIPCFAKSSANILDLVLNVADPRSSSI